MLRSHLQEMAIRRRSLTAHEADVAVKVAGDLALGALAQGVVGHDSERGIPNSTLYEAACRFIRINIARMDLTAETIARGIGCSRSHLYRVFELQDETVGMAIRRYRFENAVSCLKMHPIRRSNRLPMSPVINRRRHFRGSFAIIPVCHRDFQKAANPVMWT